MHRVRLNPSSWTVRAIVLPRSGVAIAIMALSAFSVAREITRSTNLTAQNAAARASISTVAPQTIGLLPILKRTDFRLRWNVASAANPSSLNVRTTFATRYSAHPIVKYFVLIAGKHEEHDKKSPLVVKYQRAFFIIMD